MTIHLLDWFGHPGRMKAMKAKKPAMPANTKKPKTVKAKTPTKAMPSAQNKGRKAKNTFQKVWGGQCMGKFGRRWTLKDIQLFRNKDGSIDFVKDIWEYDDKDRVCVPVPERGPPLVARLDLCCRGRGLNKYR